jgi:hypothetical protein
MYFQQSDFTTGVLKLEITYDILKRKITFHQKG